MHTCGFQPQHSTSQIPCHICNSRNQVKSGELKLATGSSLDLSECVERGGGGIAQPARWEEPGERGETGAAPSWGSPLPLVPQVAGTTAVRRSSPMPPLPLAPQATAATARGRGERPPTEREATPPRLPTAPPAPLGLQGGRGRPPPEMGKADAARGEGWP